MTDSQRSPWDPGRLRISHQVGHGEPDLRLVQPWQTNISWYRYSDEDPEGEERDIKLGSILWSLVDLKHGARAALDDLDSLGADELNLGAHLAHIERTGQLRKMCRAAAIISHVELHPDATGGGIDRLSIKEIARTILFARTESIILMNGPDISPARGWTALGFTQIPVEKKVWFASASDLVGAKNADFCQGWVSGAWWRE